MKDLDCGHYVFRSVRTSEPDVFDFWTALPSSFFNHNKIRSPAGFDENQWQGVSQPSSRWPVRAKVNQCEESNCLECKAFAPRLNFFGHNVAFWFRILVTAVISISVTIGGFSLSRSHTPATLGQPVYGGLHSGLLDALR